MACFLINRSPKATFDWKVVEEFWIGGTVDYTSLEVFGCLANMHVSSKERLKLEAKSRHYIFRVY